MKHTVFAAVLLSLLAFITFGQSGHDLFQKALVKERAEGNVQEAIEIYQRIIREFGSDRSLAADALVHIGQCYEKLGKSEAQRAYERVVRDYADQPEPVKVARARLAALVKTEHAELTVRKIWSGRLVDVLGEISPDGRHLSFVDWMTGDLAVRDLAAGTNQRLTNKGTWVNSSDFALFSRWSPDGKRIAYDWYVNPSAADTSEQQNELRVVTVVDSQSRVLYRPPNKTYVVTQDWSPDGTQILAVLGLADGTDLRLVSISAGDGSVRVLKELGRSYLPAITFVFSPDGRHVLCNFVSGARAPEGDLFLISADGSVENRIQHPANELAFGWSLDGKWALFLSDRTGTLDLWALPVLDGKSGGEAQLVKPGVGGVVPLGMDRTGSIYYGTLGESSNIYVAGLDARTGGVLQQPVKAIKRFEGLNNWPSYSRDGKQLAYVSARRSLSMARRLNNVLCIRSLETGEEREFSTEFMRLAGPTWSPDGHAIFVHGLDFHGSGAINRVDSQSGEVTPVVQAKPPASIQAHAVSPDGKTLYYVRREKQGEPWKIVARDLAGGHEKELFSGPPGDRFSISLSPEGRRIALLGLPMQVEGERTLSVMDAAGGEPKEVHRFKQFGNRWAPVAWSADGRYILFPKQRYETVKEQMERGRQVSASEGDQDKPEWSLWRVPASGGEAHDLKLEMQFGSLDVHPDGRQIVFASKSETLGAEVWVIENLLPQLSSKR